jgi:hypothetical protein
MLRESTLNIKQKILIRISSYCQTNIFSIIIIKNDINDNSCYFLLLKFEKSL